MSSEIDSIGETAGAAAVETAWAQWSALAAVPAAAGSRPGAAIVDPEALVLLSLAMIPQERRLNDLVSAFARSASPLLSVQRMGTLARRIPAARDALGGFARTAAEAGDRRWRARATEASGPPARAKSLGELRLLAPPALQLRLRAGLGVGTKADLLALLLGLAGEPVSVRVASEALAYSPRAVRTAAEEMVLAGFVERIDGAPVSYAAEGRAWSGLLSPGAQDVKLPRWRFWSAVFAFLVDAGAWAEQGRAEEWSGYLAASRARDLVETHAPGLRLARIRLPDPRAARGAEYLGAFAGLVESVGAYCRRSL